MVLFLSIQFAGAQNIKYKFESFFETKDQLAYHTLCQWAIPNDRFIRGSYIEDGDNVYVTIYADNGTLHVNLHKTNDIFDKIEKAEPTDWATPFVPAKVLKYLSDDLVKRYKADAIAWIEKKMGTPLKRMSADQMCLASLTLLLWTY